MHELSLAMEVIELAVREAEKNRISVILEMEIEVGDLSGVEADTFRSALEMIVRDTILENTLINVVRTPALGYCSNCNNEYEMRERLATCPLCRAYPSAIRGGQDFRLVSILAE